VKGKVETMESTNFSIRVLREAVGTRLEHVSPIFAAERALMALPSGGAQTDK
jgi:hypothetical protein